MPEEVNNNEVFSESETRREDTEKLSEGVLHDRFIPRKKATLSKSVKLEEDFTLSGAVKASGTAVTNANTNAATSMDSYTLNKNAWHVGMTVRIYAAGTASIDASGDTFKVAVAQEAKGTGSFSNINEAEITGVTATNTPWWIDWIGIVTALGSSGTIEGFMRCNINDTIFDDPNTSAFSIDTTIDQTLNIITDWGTAKVANTATMRQALFEILN